MTNRRPAPVKAKTINALTEGCIDTHAHFGPDSKMERATDVEGLLELASDLKLRGLVLKSKDYPTYPLAHVGKAHFPTLEPIGAVCLDHDVGGLNPDAVKTSGKLGARIVWLPTFSSRKDVVRFGRPPEDGIYCLDAEGDLTSETVAVLREIKKYDLVLATGHLDNQETRAVVTKALEMGIGRIVITHPITARAEGVPTIEELKRYASQGCYIEHVAFGLMPQMQVITPAALAQAIQEIGPEHCIMSSDLGQAWNPPPPYGMKMFIAMMLGQGLKDEEVEVMVKTNPAKVVGV